MARPKCFLCGTQNEVNGTPQRGTERRYFQMTALVNSNPIISHL